MLPELYRILNSYFHPTMGDESPGKVQALRTFFLEKNTPVMGVMPPGGKIPTRPWRNIPNEKITLKEHSPNEQIIPVNKVLPFPIKRLDLNSANHTDAQNRINGASDKAHFQIQTKPNVGPKPSYLAHQGRTSSSNTLNSVSSDSNDSMSGNEFSDRQEFQKSHAKSKAVGETIASFMFSTGEKTVSIVADNKTDFNKSILLATAHRTDSSTDSSKSALAATDHIADSNVSVNKNVLTATDHKNHSILSFNQPPVPKPRTSPLQSTTEDKSKSNSQTSDIVQESDFSDSCSNLINSDNYICKGNGYFRRKTLPTKEKLGSAPLKPFKPPHLKLPSNRLFTSEPKESPPQLKPSLPLPNAPPALPLKPAIQRPSYPCPPRPSTSPPLPPNVSVPVIRRPDPKRSPITSLREEIEELYEDTLLQNDETRPASLIPEYTEEEEQGEFDLEELYNDVGEEVPSLPPKPSLMKPKEALPPRPPSEYLQPNIHSGSVEELYQDALEPCEDQFYEEMPIELTPEEPGAPLYSNNRKEIEKLRREEEKRLKKEQKEKEKKDREIEKMKRKFGLTGDEVPIDAGLVKTDCRGGKGDLPVKRGETVLILRMEGNPSGRWLVKNEKGKIGYVELTNIEVMTIRRLSVISASEELYCEAMSEEEAIYETTY